MITYLINKELLSSQKIQSSDFLKGLCESIIAIYPNGAPVLPWAGYLIEEQGLVVGTCAYKSPPVAGEIEIAYFTFPEYEGRGVATRMAETLVNLAIANGITRVKAQTLPENNASTHILEKLGFTFAGLVQHPEDGEVWEWHK